MNRHTGSSQRARTRLGLAAVALASALAVLPGCGQPDSAELVKSARELIAKKDTEAARVQLKTAIQAAPDLAEARFLLGQLLHDGGDMAGAEVELRRALEQKQPESDVLPLLANALLAQGKGPQLLQQYGSTQLPDAAAQARLHTTLAAAEANAGELDAAMLRIEAVLRGRPAHAQALLLRARLTAAKGDMAGALAQVKALTDSQADNAEAWLLQGELLQRSAASPAAADPAAALGAYQQALKAKPDSVSAHTAIISQALTKGDIPAATAQWQALQKALPRHPQTMFFEAVLAEQKGEYAKVRELTQQLLRGTPNNPQVLMLAGQAELKLNALAQAEALFGKAAQLNPKAAGPRRQVAQVQLRTGQADKALATMAPLLAAEAPDIDLLTMAAQAHIMKGDTAAADAIFARAAKLKPEDPRVRLALALQGAGKGQVPKAVSEMRAIAAADKGTAADMALISVLTRTKDYDGAAAAIDALATKLPGEALPDHLRGTVALQRGQGPVARKHFEAALAKNADYLPAMAGLAALDVADKQPAAGKARFEAALQRNPKNTSAMMALAELTARSGAPATEVIAWLEKAVAADPNEVTPRLLLVDQLMGSNQLKTAITAAQAGLEALPDNVELLDRLGRAQLASGDSQQAVSTFNKMVAAAPRSVLAQLRLADAQAAARNPQAVAAAVRRAAELGPDQPAVLRAQFTLATSEDRLDQAQSLARKLQAQRPDDAAGYNMEAEVEMRRQRWDSAAVLLRKAVTKAQPGDAPQRLHAALLGGKKAAEADAMAAEWRQKNPGDMAFVLHLGDMAMGQRQYDKASALYQEVLERQPENVLALNNQAYSLASQKKPGAVAMAEKALAKAPQSAAVMDTLAFALAADNQLPKAVEVQARAVATAPGTPTYRLQLARLQLQSGDKAGARSELSTLAALGSKFPRQAEVAELIKSTAQ